MSKNIPALIVVVLLILIIALTMCAFQVRFTETAVVTRFDKIQDVFTPEQAGLHFKMPWPIERVHTFDTRLRTFETKFNQIGTRDQKTVVLTAYATWRINEGRIFLEAVGDEENADIKIRDLLNNRVQAVLRTHDLDELVNTDAARMRFSTIEDEFLNGTTGESAIGDGGTSIKDKAEKDYGIEVVSVGIKRLGLPESVTKEVFARMTEDRQKVIKELKAEGDARATQITADADQIAQKILARAQAYAKTLEGEGDAEAARYYRVFAENRRLSDFLKKLETVQKILETGQVTLVLDANTFVPFDLLRQASMRFSDKAVEAPVGAGTATGASDAAVAATTPESTRE